jgi:hypothetical protein
VRVLALLPMITSTPTGTWPPVEMVPMPKGAYGIPRTVKSVTEPRKSKIVCPRKIPQDIRCAAMLYFHGALNIRS